MRDLSLAAAPETRPRAPGAPRPARLGWLVPAVITGGLIPAASLALAAARGALGANPVAEVMNQLGILTLALLVASLAATPLKIVTGWTWPIRIRKTLGLLAFAYACAHFLVYAAVDQGLDLAAVADDIAERPFIFVGVAALLLLIPLAVTSTARMMKRLGNARWKRIHRMAYLAAALGVVHFVMRVKKDVTEPAIYGTVLGALLLVRIVDWARRRYGNR
ncbi:sulfite oxidase heme-binding subunit YedZ [Chondromyces apiculatus]|uniref:Protein-methionine-sulfoxide reductase heme-binding subunit MsrQ n=1 Tax=Chondromyces apiculatus DSM 436 TaxID=1192034 RepID=A0A017SZR0_9BACT|nr:protein-methionine-sulfoxide reductase heme-binding subunit MsrQ [Chondromyces apiculatus]EYF02469.1 Membrane protein YedZ [Chondromyces apiculatus DSM 436]